MAKQKKKRWGHWCWFCQRVQPNERFGGKGHAHHICRECTRARRAGALPVKEKIRRWFEDARTQPEGGNALEPWWCPADEPEWFAYELPPFETVLDHPALEPAIRTEAELPSWLDGDEPPSGPAPDPFHSCCNAAELEQFGFFDLSPGAVTRILPLEASLREA